MDALAYMVFKYLEYCVWMFIGLKLFRGGNLLPVFAAPALAVARIIPTFYLFLVLRADTPLKEILPIMFGSGLLWLVSALVVAGRVKSRSIYWALGGLSISAAFDVYALLNTTWDGRWSC
jgi:hypothetical protein